MVPGGQEVSHKAQKRTASSIDPVGGSSLVVSRVGDIPCKAVCPGGIVVSHKVQKRTANIQTQRAGHHCVSGEERTVW